MIDQLFYYKLFSHIYIDNWWNIDNIDNIIIQINLR